MKLTSVTINNLTTGTQFSTHKGKFIVRLNRDKLESEYDQSIHTRSNIPVNSVHSSNRFSLRHLHSCFSYNISQISHLSFEMFVHPSAGWLRCPAGGGRHDTHKGKRDRRDLRVGLIGSGDDGKLRRNSFQHHIRERWKAGNLGRSNGVWGSHLV